jgi:membrane protease YdiL (CAAX protease family)
VADVEDRRLAAAGLWVCACGYANVDGGRCDLCGKPAAGAVKTATVLRAPRAPEAGAAPPLYARRATGATPLYAPPALVILVIAVVGGNYAYQHGVVALLKGKSLDVALLASLLCGLLFYMATWIVASTVGRAVRVAPAWHRSRVQALLAGLGAGAVAAAFGAAVAFSSNGRAALDPTAVLLIDDGRWVALLVGVLVIAVAAPVVEEYVFRGLVAQAFADHNRSAALWISAIAFAAAHLSPIRFPYYLAMGLLLGRVYLWRGLLASVTAHAVFNGAVLATAAIVLTTGSGAVHVAGLHLTLPGGWHQTEPPEGEVLAAFRTDGAKFEISEGEPHGIVTVELAARALAASPSFANILVQGSSAMVRSIGAGPAAQAEITSSIETGYVLVVPDGPRMYVLTARAPLGVDFSADFEAILASTRLDR